jgi:hypothetical protein
MDVLTSAWVLSVLVMMVSLPMAGVRGYAYYSGERDHTRTMWIAMVVAVVAAGIAVAAFLGLTIALLVR